MKAITTITQLLLTLLTLAVFVWAVWHGYLLLTSEQKSLEPDIQSILVIGTVVLLSCTFILATAIRKGAVAVGTGKRKAVLYEQFTSTWLQKEEVNEMAREKVEHEIDQLKAGIALLASQQVIQKVNHLLSSSRATGASSKESKAAYISLLAAMRRDLGQLNYYSIDRDYEKLFSTTATEEHKTFTH